jgi:hypothetical protein
VEPVLAPSGFSGILLVPENLRRAALRLGFRLRACSAGTGSSRDGNGIGPGSRSSIGTGGRRRDGSKSSFPASPGPIGSRGVPKRRSRSSGRSTSFRMPPIVRVRALAETEAFGPRNERDFFRPRVPSRGISPFPSLERLDSRSLVEFEEWSTSRAASEGENMKKRFCAISASLSISVGVLIRTLILLAGTIRPAHAQNFQFALAESTESIPSRTWNPRRARLRIRRNSHGEEKPRLQAPNGLASRPSTESHRFGTFGAVGADGSLPWPGSPRVCYHAAGGASSWD